jgi:RNA polymerase sigma factor (sigma-70 family)
VDEHDWLADRFEDNRSRLWSMAYRMLGSLTEADDAVQEAWLRLSRSGADGIENPDAWLTTIISRVCLNMLRSRGSRHEEPVGAHVPDPLVTREHGTDPEDDALLADSVGQALHVVLQTLSPPERLAFVLHDMFAVPFADVARLVERSPDATRQLASRARRRVQGATAVPHADLNHQKHVLDAFFKAARAGDFEALLAVLDPDIVVRSDGGALRPELSMVVRGATGVARRAAAFSRREARLHPVLVNGGAGVVATLDGRPFSIMGFTIAGGRIVTVDILADPERIARLDLPTLDE